MSFRQRVCDQQLRRADVSLGVCCRWANHARRMESSSSEFCESEELPAWSCIGCIGCLPGCGMVARCGEAGRLSRLGGDGRERRGGGLDAKYRYSELDARRRTWMLNLSEAVIALHSSAPRVLAWRQRLRLRHKRGLRPARDGPWQLNTCKTAPIICCANEKFTSPGPWPSAGPQSPAWPLLPGRNPPPTVPHQSNPPPGSHFGCDAGGSVAVRFNWRNNFASSAYKKAMHESGIGVVVGGDRCGPGLVGLLFPLS